MTDNSWLDAYPTAPQAPAGDSSLLDKYATAPRPPQTPKEAQGILGAVDAVYQSSTLGLMFRGKNPDVLEPSKPTLGQEAASDVTALGLGLVQGAAGAVVGAGVGAAAGEGVGAIPGAFVGSMAVPMAVRGALVTAYDQGNGPKSWGQIFDIAKNSLIEGTKGAAAGTAYLATGGAATPEIMGSMLGVGGTKAILASKLAKITALSAANGMASGHVIPTWGDFGTGALALIGHGDMTPEETATAGFVQKDNLANKLADLY